MDISNKRNGLFKISTVFLLGVAVAACGGRGDPRAPQDDATDGGTDGPTDTARQLGSGTAGDFVAGKIGLPNGFSGTLSAGGTVALAVSLVDGSGNLAPDALSVTFTSDCIAQGDATLSAGAVTLVNGIGYTNYTANGCEGTDNIVATATYETTVLTANVGLPVAGAEVGLLEMSEIGTTSIAFKGNGASARPSQTNVTFKLLDKNRNPVKGKQITFAASTEVGGIKIAPISVLTDNAGLANTVISAGTVSATVNVIATYSAGDGTNISSASDPITVNTGLPDQDSFQLSIDNFSPNSYRYNNRTVAVTINAADRNNNNAADGTIVNFVASYGQISPSCTLSGGSCTVTWLSGGERNQDGVVGGIVSILARTVGEESFRDAAPSDGKFNLAELATVDQTSEPWLDFIVNIVNTGSELARGYSIFEEGQEPYFDYDLSGVFTPANDKFEGTNCDDEALAAGHCSSLIEVYDHAYFREASDAIDIEFDGSTITVTDIITNGAPPTDTTIAVSASDGVEIIGETSYTVPNSIGLNPTVFNIGIAAGSVGTIDVTVSPPDGVVTKETFSVGP